jgi:transposase
LGCHNATPLFQEIKAQGFTGRPSIVYRALQGWRQPEATLPADGRKLPHPIPSPRQVSGWLLELANPPNDPQEALRQQTFITRLCERQTEINTARSLANEFIRRVGQRQAGALSAWLTQVKDSAIQELRSFATGLQQDLAAVSAALDLPWSNGQTEGQVNRLKCIKRMMYGRASFE